MLYEKVAKNYAAAPVSSPRQSLEKNKGKINKFYCQKNDRKKKNYIKWNQDARYFFSSHVLLTSISEAKSVNITECKCKCWFIIFKRKKRNISSTLSRVALRISQKHHFNINDLSQNLKISSATTQLNFLFPKVWAIQKRQVVQKAFKNYYNYYYYYIIIIIINKKGIIWINLRIFTRGSRTSNPNNYYVI